MVLDTFDLKSLFTEMIKLAVQDMKDFSGKFGFGCSKLMDDMCMRQKPLLDRILNDYSNEGHEYRLNNAGLKMIWRMTKHYSTGERIFLCTICGDQFKDYKVLGEQLRSLIKQRGACKWTYDDKRREWETKEVDNG